MADGLLARYHAVVAFTNEAGFPDPDWVADVWGDIFGWRDEAGVWHGPVEPMAPDHPIRVGPRNWIIPQPRDQDALDDWLNANGGGFPSSRGGNQPVRPKADGGFGRGVQDVIGHLERMIAAGFLMAGAMECVCKAVKANLKRGLNGLRSAILAAQEAAVAAKNHAPPGVPACDGIVADANANIEAAWQRLAALAAELDGVEAEIDGTDCTWWTEQGNNLQGLLGISSHMDDIDRAQAGELETVKRHGRRNWMVAVGDCGGSAGDGPRQWFLCGGLRPLPRGTGVALVFRRVLQDGEAPKWNSVSCVAHTDDADFPGGIATALQGAGVVDEGVGRYEQVVIAAVMTTDPAVSSVRLEVIYSGVAGVPCYFHFAPLADGVPPAEAS